MIPSRHDYYTRRAHEHRQLASAAREPTDRAIHDRLVEAYVGLASLHHQPGPRIDLGLGASARFMLQAMSED